LIHRAAFRNGLSRSLYAPRFNLSNLNSETLEEFRQQNFTSNHLALIGLGMKHEELVKFSDLFRLPGPAANYSRQVSKYLGCQFQQKIKNYSDDYDY
jgi:hypothetical protein